MSPTRYVSEGCKASHNLRFHVFTVFETFAKLCNLWSPGISNPGRVVSAFTSSGVVPTLIPRIAPKVTVKVNYGGKAVKQGNIFTTAETLTAPSYSFSGESGFDPATTTYSFFMV